MSVSIIGYDTKTSKRKSVLISLWYPLGIEKAPIPPQELRKMGTKLCLHSRTAYGHTRWVGN